MENFTLLALGTWLPIIIIAMVWSFVWKGLALWKSAKQEDKGWFIAFLLINALGILEILYIYIFSPLRHERQPKLASVETGIEASKKEKKG
jgi:Family of unknown function (DUF5652)